MAPVCPASSPFNGSAEKGYRDYGHDIDNTDSVLEAGLGLRKHGPTGSTISWTGLDSGDNFPACRTPNLVGCTHPGS